MQSHAWNWIGQSFLVNFFRFHFLRVYVWVCISVCVASFCSYTFELLLVLLKLQNNKRQDDMMMHGWWDVIVEKYNIKFQKCMARMREGDTHSFEYITQNNMDNGHVRFTVQYMWSHWVPAGNASNNSVQGITLPANWTHCAYYIYKLYGFRVFAHWPTA